MPLRTSLLTRLSLLASLLLGSSPVLAQQAAGVRRSTRAELQAALVVYENSASSSAYSERMRGRARQEAAAVRSRLAAGDFKVGDRIYLRVVGPTQLVDDTLTVDDSLTIVVPGIRSIPLQGVLRSELQPVLTRELGVVVKEVQVVARPLLRVAVLGMVGNPGYRTVSAETLVDQLITVSGGPAATAAINEMQFMRGDTILFKGEEVSRVIAQGRTLDALDIRDGDMLVVPLEGTPWDRNSVMQIASFFIGPLLGILVFR